MAKRSRRRDERARIAHEEAEAARAAAAARRRRLARFAGGGLVVAALVAVVLVVLVLGGDEETPAPAPSAEQTAVPPPASVDGADDVASQLEGIEQSANALGDPEAPFTLVEYSDLICPACATYSKDIIPALIEDYVRPGQLRIEFRPFGFVKDWSTPAAQYAWAAADQDRMWPFVKLWYLNQGDENTNYVSDEFARALATEIPGMNADQLVADAALPATREKLDDVARSFVTFNLQIVPSFVAGRTGQTLRPLEIGETAAAAKRTIDLLIATGVG
jgi:protein-disulfide isomerase